VVHGETGLLFPCRDVPAFAAAVRALIADATLRQRLGRAGRQRILAEFTEERTSARLVALYRQLAGAAGLA